MMHKSNPLGYEAMARPSGTVGQQTEAVTLLDWWERERKALQDFALEHVGKEPRPLARWSLEFEAWRLKR